MSHKYDILTHIQVNDSTITFSNPVIKSALSLSAADRRWIDLLTQTVLDGWDENYPTRAKALGFLGSEEFIRMQFEEYLLALLSSIRHDHGDQRSDFGPDFFKLWSSTNAFSLFEEHTDPHLSDVVEPRHPTAGNLTIDDVQRRLSQQITILRLDEHLASGRDTVNRQLSAGQQKVSSAVASLWAEIESRREASRQAALNETRPASDGTLQSLGKSITSRAPNISDVQATGQKAAAYLSSWGAWASERRRA